MSPARTRCLPVHDQVSSMGLLQFLGPQPWFVAFCPCVQVKLLSIFLSERKSKLMELMGLTPSGVGMEWRGRGYLPPLMIDSWLGYVTAREDLSLEEQLKKFHILQC